MKCGEMHDVMERDGTWHVCTHDGIEHDMQA